MTKEIKLANGAIILAVGVPKDAVKFRTSNLDGEEHCLYFNETPDTLLSNYYVIKEVDFHKDILLGCYENGEIDFEVKVQEEWVECYDKMDSGKCFQWVDYVNLIGCNSVKQSFLSLLHSHQLQGDKIVLILKS